MATKKKGGKLRAIEGGKKGPPAKKPKQTRHPAIPTGNDPELEKLAEALHDARSSRIEYGKDEAAAQEKLLAAMQSKGVEAFVHDELGCKVQIKSTKTKVSITKLKDDDAEVG